MRVVRFYVSWPLASSLCFSASSAGPQLQARDRSGPRRTRTANPAGPQLQVRDRSGPCRPEQQTQDQSGPCGPQLQALDRSGPCRTRTASPGSEWPLPDLNCKRYIAAVPDQSGHRTSTASARSQCPAGPEQQPLDESDLSPTSTTKNLRRYYIYIYNIYTRKNARKNVRICHIHMPERMLEYMTDSNARKNVRRYARYICQKKCQKICQIHMPEKKSKDMPGTYARKNVRWYAR